MRSILLNTALFWLLVAGAAMADDPLSLPESVEAEPGAWVKVVATTDAAGVKWIDPDGLDLDPEYPEPLIARFKAPRADGVYWLGCYAATLDSEGKASPTEIVWTTVVVGDATPEPPKPRPVPPGPKPPKPPELDPDPEKPKEPESLDQLSRDLRKLYLANNDPRKRDQIESLTVLYDEAAKAVNDTERMPKGTTARQLLTWLVDAVGILLKPNHLLKIRKRLSPELIDHLPTEAKKVLTDGDREDAARAFRRIAKSLRYAGGIQ